MNQLIFISFVFLVGCAKNIKKQEGKNEGKIEFIKENLIFDDLLLLSKSQAINKYGKPHSSEEFILDDAQGEFRNSVSDKYSQEERYSESILIDELTWEKDQENWITVWYEVKEEKSIPIEVYSWEKGSEF